MLNIKHVAIPSDLEFLIIEDTQVMQKILVIALKKLGFNGKVHMAPSLKQAQTIFTSNPIQFILLDWNLEDGTGDTFLKALRKHDKFKDLPVLMVSANDDMENVLGAIELGASDYLIKPPEENDLKEKLSNAWLKHNPGSKLESDDE